MKKRTKTIQTGLKIDVKPISDQGMTAEEYRAKIADIQKQKEVQETLDKVAEQHFPQRKSRGPVQRSQQRRGIPRAQPMRGLLHPEQPATSPFMGLLAIPNNGVKK